MIGGIADLVGNTPVVELRKLAAGLPSKVLVKIEGTNPSGSVKDRAALAMLRDAEAKGLLRPGGTIIEPTSGNMGISLSMMAAAEGYRAVIVMPDTMSAERISMMRAYGAEVVLTPGGVGMSGSIEKAKEISLKENGLILEQFRNPANAKAHVTGTAKEILEQVPDVYAVVAGIGTGGTASGIGEGLRLYGSKAFVIGVEPAESPMITQGVSGMHGIQGIGANFVPENYRSEYIKAVVTVPTKDSMDTAARLAKEEGIFAGISSGAAVRAALDLAAEVKGKRIMAILPDRGDRYISTGIFE